MFPKDKKKSDYGEVSSMFKACASLMSHPLIYIYNRSLYTGIFPDCLQIAVVKSVYKKGDENSMKITSLCHYSPFFLRY